MTLTREEAERETTRKDFLVFMFSSQKCKYFACDLIFRIMNKFFHTWGSILRRGGGGRGCAPCGFLIQLVFCKKKTMWFIGVELEQETSAPPPKKNPGSAPVTSGEIGEPSFGYTVFIFLPMNTLYVNY